MVKQEKLEKLNGKIRNFQKCSLGKARINAVMGEELLNAKVMICGKVLDGWKI